jgi:predicted flap endonuclease-1-like 5' DNA nuclease
MIAMTVASSLHVSKLRGMDIPTRNRLKRQGITYAAQLLEAAGGRKARAGLAARTGIDERALLRLARRSDLSRVKGIGAIFADMLEIVGVHNVVGLATQEPGALRAELARLNAVERFARRAPTVEEVTDWVEQARELPILLEDDQISSTALQPDQLTT